VLTIEELQQLAEKTNPEENLELIAANLVLHPKGILAADESGGSIEKKFAQLNIPDTYESRRDYRNILLSTPNLGDFVNGVILFDYAHTTPVYTSTLMASAFNSASQGTKIKLAQKKKHDKKKRNNKISNKNSSSDTKTTRKSKITKDKTAKNKTRKSKPQKQS
jgi:fructose-bisphosphate aldolase class 1